MLSQFGSVVIISIIISIGSSIIVDDHNAILASDILIINEVPQHKNCERVSKQLTQLSLNLNEN